MTASKNKIDYINKYNAKAYDHINFLVPHGVREQIKAAAKECGMSTNSFILSCIESKIEIKRSTTPDVQIQKPQS